MLANLLRCALKFQRDVVVIGATANKTNSNCDRMVKCVQCEWKMMITGVLFMISAPFISFWVRHRMLKSQCLDGIRGSF